MTEQDALKWAFPKVDEVELLQLHLSREEKTAIEVATSGVVGESDQKVYVGKRGDEIEGYAIITNEIGKFEYITFIVKVNTKMKVDKVSVMIYRETRGGEIHRQRFLQQYRGKQIKDPLKINRDIINVTGATMSVRSINRGVRKVLKIIQDNVAK